MMTEESFFVGIFFAMLSILFLFGLILQIVNDKKIKKNIEVKKATGYKTVVSAFRAMKCSKCNRLMPNKKHLTENGCIWCDEKYHRKQMKLQNFLNKYKRVRNT